MSRHTHDAIMNSFSELIHELPFDRITVAELVRRAGVSPNTFYYHYKDIYVLLGDWLLEGLKRFIRRNPQGTAPREVLKQALRMCKKHEIATYHIYNSLSRDALERFAFRQTEDIIKSGIERLSSRYNVTIPEDRLGKLSTACKFMLLGMFLQFVWDKMTEDIDTLVDTFMDMMDDFLSAEMVRFSTR